MFSALGLSVAAVTAQAEITTEPLTNPDNQDDVWGQKITGLGFDGGETALVFTKTGETMSWTLPEGKKVVRYLVVGGGGGGGGGKKNVVSGRGGGGGGGVLTEKDVITTAGEFSVAVGIGGVGMAADAGNGNGTKGGDSQLSFGDLDLTAYGGGGGSDGATVGQGGATVGCGGGGGKNVSGGVVTAGQGCNGGSGRASDYAGGGGGGAGAPGSSANGTVSGKGGDGIASDITGVEVWYAGGGGGSKASNSEPKVSPVGGKGGGGNGAYVASNLNGNGGNATAFGGGGGGAHKTAKGGDGYQGVVIVRYRMLAENEVLVPTIASAVYNGEPQTADIADDEGYTVTANEGGVNVDDYVVTLTLNEGYFWVGGSTDPTNLTFTITKAENSWTTAPSLTKTAWELDEDPAGVDPGVAASKTTVVVTFDDGAEEMPRTIGNHTAIFMVAESPNYLGFSTTLNYTINKNTNVWTVEPALDKETWATDEANGVLNDYQAKYGQETLEVLFDDDPAGDISNTLGAHTIKFSIKASDEYTALSKTINYTVTKKVNGWDVNPVVPTSFNIEDPMPTFVPPVPKYGEVKCYYDNDTSITETPTDLGKHKVTYEVVAQDTDDFEPYAETFTFEVTYKPIFDCENPSVVAGYRLPKLGANQDEVALVFTNTASAVAYKLPSSVTEISYLVVGGGAAGGSSNNNNGAGGGGAGGVVTNEGPFAVSAGATFTVKVGAGGASVLGGKGNAGANSALWIEGSEFKALRGEGGANGGKASGGDTYACGGGAGGTAAATVWAGGVGTVSKGGTAQGYSAGGGGGGAGGDGVNYNTYASTSPEFRRGGKGVLVTIFDQEEDWIAGGGSGSRTGDNTYPSIGGGGKGGDAGDMPTAGTAWGAGGGGGTKTGARSGAGHQGVVVVRYAEEANLVMVPVIQSKIYTGETLTAEVPENAGYTVTANAGGIDVVDGGYPVVLTLNDGYHWDGGSTEPTNLVFMITPAENEWADGTPAVSKSSWFTDDAEVVLTPGATKFGKPTATIAKDGAEATAFGGTLPTEPGRYEIVYTVESSDNWIDPEESSRSVAFTIVSAEEVPPFTVTMGETATLVDGARVDLSVGFQVGCEVASPKTVDIFALYFEDGAEVTNEVLLASGVALDAEAAGTIPGLKAGVTYMVALYGRGGSTVAPTTEFRAVTVKGPATDLQASATFTNDPKEFIITGSVTPGLGTTTVTVYYHDQNTEDFASATPTLDENNAFVVRVPYTGLYDRLTWYVTVENTFGEQIWNPDTNPELQTPQQTKNRLDTAAVTYTWTGTGADNSWQNPDNWSADVAVCFGVPDNANATAKFTKDAVVNLCGSGIDLKADTGLTLSTKIEVVLTNGTLNADSEKDASLGAANSTLVIGEGASLKRKRVNPVDNMTVIFEGASHNSSAKADGMTRATSQKNTSIIFRNGVQTLTGWITGYSSTSLITIDNAKLNNPKEYNTAWAVGSIPMKFADGADRPAQIVATGASGWNFKASMKFTLSDKAYDLPRLQAVKHFTSVTDQSLPITVDVTNWKRSKKVPLIKFTSSTEQTSFAQLVENATFIVRDYSRPEGEQDVKAERGAELVWDGAANTLYFKQKNLGGMAVIIR